MERYRWLNVYETSSWYYIVGTDITEERHAVLKVPINQFLTTQCTDRSLCTLRSAGDWRRWK
jgi:hypothetical protein